MMNPCNRAFEKEQTIKLRADVDVSLSSYHTLIILQRVDRYSSLGKILTHA